MGKKSFYTRRCFYWDILISFALCILGFLLYYHVQESPRPVLPQEWQWERFGVYFWWTDETGWYAGLLLKGLLHTVRMGLWAGLVALLLGFWLGIRFSARCWGISNKVLYVCALLLRNTPPLVLLFLLYFLTGENTLAMLGEIMGKMPQTVQTVCTWVFAAPDHMDRMLAAVLTLGCYQGVYVAEIVRAGLQGLPQGQWDAAAALGFSRKQQMFAVLLPQTLPFILPPLAGQAVSIFKDSALASLISVPDLTFQGMEIMAITRLPFETWMCVALLYLLLSLLCTRCFAYMEKRLRWHKKAV